MLIAFARVEFLNNGRVHDRYGPYQTLLRDGLTSGQSEEDRQGYKKIYRHGLDAKCPQASRNTDARAKQSIFKVWDHMTQCIIAINHSELLVAALAVRV